MNLKFKKKVFEHIGTNPLLSIAWIQTWWEINVQIALCLINFILDTESCIESNDKNVASKLKIRIDFHKIYYHISTKNEKASILNWKNNMSI